MTGRTLVTIAVVAVLVLAGCTSGGQQTTTPTPTLDGGGTVSPGQQTTTAPTVESVNAPGIENGTVTNASAIVAAHEDRLRNESFTTRFDQTIRAPGLDSTSDAEIRYGGSGGYNQTVAVVSDSEGNYTQTRWTPGFRAAGYGKTTLESGRVGYYRTTSLGYESAVSAGLLGRLVEVYELEATDAGTVDGRPVVVVEATAVTNTTRLQREWLLDQRPRNTSFRMAVDEDGVVRAFSHSVSTNDTTIRVNQTVSAVGSTSVTEPRWVETAVRQTREFTFDANESSGRISLNFTAGADVPAGTTMEFDPNNTGDPTEFTLNTTLEAGNVYYVAVEDGEPYLTTEQPPARELNGKFYVLSAVDEDGDVIFRVFDDMADE
jgi:hypothetical protein